VRFDTIYWFLDFGKIIHDYLTIRSNLGALYVGFMANLNRNVSAVPDCFLRANLSDIVSFLQVDHRILKAIAIEHCKFLMFISASCLFYFLHSICNVGMN